MRTWAVRWPWLVLIRLINCSIVARGYIVPPQPKSKTFQRLISNQSSSHEFETNESLSNNEETRDEGFPSLTQVDVIFGSKTSLVYDEGEGRYLPTEMIRHELDEFQVDENRLSHSILGPLINSPPVTVCRKAVAYHIRPYLAAAFVPEGVTSSYYRYTRWRVFQRWINANLQVFGTQSLLLGLGIKTKSLAAVSAALNWVLKDALGKIVRMMWASKMGGRFDSDAKRWRMRASFLYAFGNGMEIATYVMPQLFLLFATLANCCKQMSMLTCSSTRTALYNSFRDGTRENIGDITAKGEASIAVVDLLGIGTGVALSRIIGTAPRAVISAYCILQTIEIFCIYRMLRTVQFRVLNFERLVQVLRDFTNDPATNSILNSKSRKFTNGEALTANDCGVKSPEQMANTEKILKPPAHLTRRALAFGSLSRARLDPDELTKLLDIFAKEKFLLVVGRNMKKRGLSQRLSHPKDPTLSIQENCHIVLHTEATNADIVKSSLALILLRQKLARIDHPDPDHIRSRDCLEMVQEACQEAERLLPRLLRQLADQGWTSPAKYMFGRVTMRAYWPLKARHVGKKTST